MQILIRIVLGQVLTVCGTILAMCLLGALAMALSPFTTKYSMFVHLANQPFLEQVRMAFTSFTKKRYMIGQTGRKPLGSCLGMLLLAAIGLVSMFVSTAVFQSSHTELKNTPTFSPALLSLDNIDRKTSDGVNGNVAFPVLGDSHLGPQPAKDTNFPITVLPTDYWNHAIVQNSSVTTPQFSGNVSVTLSDPNWSAISADDDKTVTTTVMMSIDGVTAEDLPSSKPGTVNMQLLDGGSPALMDLPVVSEANQGVTTQNTYAFAIAGIYTLDYVQFSLIKFDAQSWPEKSNLESYYDYLAQQQSWTSENGTDMFNYTYDYSTKETYDKDTLESDMQQTGDHEVKYSLIALRNTTGDKDLFHSYALTKRSVHRESSVKSTNNTINLVEYHYQVQITRYPYSSNLQDNVKVHYTGGKHTSNGGIALPITPMFSTAQKDFVNMASLTNTPRIYTAVQPETYIDIFPTVILLAVYAVLILMLTVLAYAWNFHRCANKAYSMPLESLNYLLYNPGNALVPLFQKVRRAELAMVDGYDPTTGYNHLGLVGPDDAARISYAEPDVPYGIMYKTPSGMLETESYP